MKLCAVVLVSGLALAAAAAPAAGQPFREVSFAPGSSVVGRFEFGETAVRPPGNVSGALVLEAREPSTVKGAVTVFDDTTARTGAGRGDDELARVDLEVAAGETVRVPLAVPVRGIGTVRVLFQPDPEAPERLHVDPVELTGISPVAVSLDADPQAPLVSLPGRPAELTVTLAALPGANLTAIRLTAPGSSEEVGIGDLPAGKSATATLVVAADGEPRFRGVDRSVLLPVLHGQADGVPFSHPLHRSGGDRLEPIRPLVYIASESAVFVLPPREARLGERTGMDAILLNAGTEPVHARGRIDLSLPGLPHLGARFDVEARLGAGSAETVRLDWTPPGAGPWQATVRHGLGTRQPQLESIPVAGPIADADLAPARLERGDPATLRVTLTASEAVTVGGVRLATSRVPLEGVISSDDLFAARPLPATAIGPGQPATLELGLVPKAAGSYDVLLVVETPDGPSVHPGATLAVAGQGHPWLAWTPTALVAAFVAVHAAWRRWWAA